jgi:hypothetical protein
MMDKYDSAAAASVWQRVNPQEDPYPDAERGRFEGMMQVQPIPPGLSRPAVSAPPMNGGGELYRGLLREEVRHMQQVLSMLENALA